VPLGFDEDSDSNDGFEIELLNSFAKENSTGNKAENGDPHEFAMNDLLH
jgi:hypothetical protein